MLYLDESQQRVQYVNLSEEEDDSGDTMPRNETQEGKSKLSSFVSDFKNLHETMNNDSKVQVD